METGPGKKPKVPGHNDARVYCLARDNDNVVNAIGATSLSLGVTDCLVSKKKECSPCPCFIGELGRLRLRPKQRWEPAFLGSPGERAEPAPWGLSSSRSPQQHSAQPGGAQDSRLVQGPP